MPTTHTEIDWRGRLKESYDNAIRQAEQSADERTRLHHNEPATPATIIDELEKRVKRYRDLVIAINGVDKSYRQETPGLGKSFLTLLTCDGLAANGNCVLTGSQLRKATPVFCSEILPGNICRDDLRLPIVASKQLLLGKCPHCGKMQLVVRQYRRDDRYFWRFRQITRFFLLCLDCECVYRLRKCGTVLEKAD